MSSEAPPPAEDGVESPVGSSARPAWPEVAAVDRAACAVRRLLRGQELADALGEAADADPDLALAELDAVYVVWQAHRAETAMSPASSRLSWADDSQLAEAAICAQLKAADMLFAYGSGDEALKRLGLARVVLGAGPSPAVAASLLRGLLRSCHEWAARQRAAGRAAVAVDLLALALAALDASASPRGAEALKIRARLLRQLALSHCALALRGQALASAHEAVEAEAPQMAGRAASLKVLLSVLSDAETPHRTQPDAGMAAGPGKGLLTSSEVNSARRAALELMDHKGLSVAECLAACDELSAGPWPTDLAFACLSALEWRLADDDPDALRSALVFRLQLAAKRVGAAPRCALAEDALREALSQAEAAPDEEVSSTAVAAAGAAMRATLDAGCPDAAAAWQRCALPFARCGRDRADICVALAVCQLCAGRPQDAQKEAGDALALLPGHLGASILLCLEAAWRGDCEESCRHLERAGEEGLGALSSDLARLLLAGQGPVSWAPLLLGTVAPGERTAAAEEEGGVQPAGLPWTLSSAVAQAQLMVVLRRPANEMVGLMRELCDLIEEQLRNGSPCGELGPLAQLAQLSRMRAEMLRQAEAWEELASLLEALRRLLGCIGAPRAESAHCAAHLAAALLGCALRAEEANAERVEMTGAGLPQAVSPKAASPVAVSLPVASQAPVPTGPNAKELCHKALELLGEARGLLAEAGGGTEELPLDPGADVQLGDLLSLLWLLEAQVCERLGGAAAVRFEEQVSAAVRGSSHGSWQRPPLLAMAQAAGWTPLGQYMGAHYLALQLAGCGPAGGEPRQRALVRRELLQRLPPLEQLPVVLQAMAEAGGPVASSVAPAAGAPAAAPTGHWPEGEAEWLAALAWERAAWLRLSGDAPGGQASRWADVGLCLLQSCRGAEHGLGGAERALEGAERALLLLREGSVA